MGSTIMALQDRIDMLLIEYVTCGMKAGVSTAITVVSNMSAQTLIARGSTELLSVTDRPGSGEASQGRMPSQRRLGSLL